MWFPPGLLAALALATSGVIAGQDLSRAACVAELDGARRDWRAVGPPRPQPPLAAGQLVRHWATVAAGVWLIEQTSPAGTALTRVSPDAVITMRWAADCQVSRDERRRPAATPPAFTDADLTSLVASTAAGVIYLWSPHLPLSVDGYAQVAAAAARRGLRVEPLLAAGANRGFAAEAVAAGRMPAGALRVADAVELEFRDFSLHAPALVIFADGQLRGPVLPGYKTADEYAAFLARILDGR